MWPVHPKQQKHSKSSNRAKKYASKYYPISFFSIWKDQKYSHTNQNRSLFLWGAWNPLKKRPTGYTLHLKRTPNICCCCCCCCWSKAPQTQPHLVWIHRLLPPPKVRRRDLWEHRLTPRWTCLATKSGRATATTTGSTLRQPLRRGWPQKKREERNRRQVKKESYFCGFCWWWWWWWWWWWLVFLSSAFFQPEAGGLLIDFCFTATTFPTTQCPGSTP